MVCRPVEDCIVIPVVLVVGSQTVPIHSSGRGGNVKWHTCSVGACLSQISVWLPVPLLCCYRWTGQVLSFVALRWSSGIHNVYVQQLEWRSIRAARSTLTPAEPLRPRNVSTDVRSVSEPIYTSGQTVQQPVISSTNSLFKQSVAPAYWQRNSHQPKENIYQNITSMQPMGCDAQLPAQLYTHFSVITYKLRSDWPRLVLFGLRRVHQ